MEGSEPRSSVTDSKIGVLLIHGYTGAPGSLYPQADLFMKEGFNIELPLLPGHGTVIGDMENISYTRWLETVENAFLKLQKRVDKLFIFGLSMGGSLAFYLAEKYSDSISGLIIVNNTLYIKEFMVNFAPFLRIFKKVIPGISNDIKAPGVTEPCYMGNPVAGVFQLHKMLKKIKKNIHKVTCPTVIFKSYEDHVIPVEVAEYTYEHISSADKKLIFLNDSYHVATLDNDKDTINQVALNFIYEKSAAGVKK